MEHLHPIEIRVLGALLEKDMSTPEYYPLTVNALQNACNQKSSREPVVNFNEETVTTALASLQHKGMVTRISGAGHRVEKYGHRLGETLNLGRRELAVLCVLMLRGAQTVGELRGRTERMHEFADMDEVEYVLKHLSDREESLVAPVARGRWVQIMSGPPDESASPEPPVISSSPLEDRVEALEREVAELKQQLEGFRKQFE